MPNVTAALREAGPVRLLKEGATRTLLVLLILWAGAAVGLAAGPNYPELAGRITDNAHLLKPEDRSWIESELQSLEATSTDQIAVVTVPSLDGYPIEDYGIGLARKWQIGQKGKDNGILLIVAPTEHKVRIEIGRRLEPLMTDTMSKIIIQNAIIPKIRRGDFSGGIRDGVRDIKAVLLGDAEEVKNRSKVTRSPEADITPYIHLAIWIAIVAFILWSNYRATQQLPQTIGPDGRRRLQRRGYGSSGPIIIPGGNSGWGGGWSSGDSGGGGSWSGGGGDFGGGGASGDW
jgi:uncharacterized protein